MGPQLERRVCKFVFADLVASSGISLCRQRGHKIDLYRVRGSIMFVHYVGDYFYVHFWHRF